MATQAQILERIKHLSARREDRIKLAAALAKLDMKKPKPLTMRDLEQLTGKKLRTLNYLLYLGRRMGELKLTEKQYLRIGWTKCVLLAQYCDADDAKALLDAAIDCSVDELRHYFEHGITKTRTSILLRLSDHQYKVFEAVLRDHGAKPADSGKGLQNKEAALTKALSKLQKAAD